MEIVEQKREKKEVIIEKACKILSEKGLIIYPTETCYGVGVDSTNQKAVDKVLQYKTKRSNKPLSIAVYDQNMASEYAIINDTAKNIFKNFLPGPITVVTKGKNKVAKGVEAVNGTIGIRIPDYTLIRDIVKAYGKPLTATSANASYKKTPYCIDDILCNISQKQKGFIDFIIDAGTLPKRKTSSVIDTTLEGIHILRKGDLHLQNCTIFESSSEEDTQKLAKDIFQQIKKYIGKKLILFELHGDLGAGKTYFTKFFAKYLGIKDPVVSPTFILCNEYQTQYNKKTLYVFHIDAYRLYETSEIDDLGSDTIFQESNIIFIEWASKVSDYISSYLNNAVVVKLQIQHVAPTVRRIEYTISSKE